MALGFKDPLEGLTIREKINHLMDPHCSYDVKEPVKKSLRLLAVEYENLRKEKDELEARVKRLEAYLFGDEDSPLPSPAGDTIIVTTGAGVPGAGILHTATGQGSVRVTTAMTGEGSINISGTGETKDNAGITLPDTLPDD